MKKHYYWQYCVACLNTLKHIFFTLMLCWQQVILLHSPKSVTHVRSSCLCEPVQNVPCSQPGAYMDFVNELNNSKSHQIFCWIEYIHYTKYFQQLSNPEISLVLSPDPMLHCNVIKTTSGVVILIERPQEHKLHTVCWMGQVVLVIDDWMHQWMDGSMQGWMMILNIWFSNMHYIKITCQWSKSWGGVFLQPNLWIVELFQPNQKVHKKAEKHINTRPEYKNINCAKLRYIYVAQLIASFA